MKNKKILIVCQYFYPEKISSGILPYEMGVEFAKSGYDVAALVGYPSEYTDDVKIPKKEILDGMKVKRIKYLSLSRNSIIGRLLNYFSFCISVFFHFMEFKNIDYCISYTNPPMLPLVISWFSKLFKFKYIFEVYDLYPDVATKSKLIGENSLVAKIFNKATCYALKTSWKIIALSNECKDYIVRNKNINSSKVVVIPNWYKTQKQIKIKDNHKMTILYGGNIGIMQDIETICQLVLSLKSNQNISFIFCGHGKRKHMIEDLIKEHSLKNCKVYDFLPKKTYDELMNDVDMAIVSIEKYTIGLGSPSKYYGYLSKGIPIIGIMDECTDIVRDIKNTNCGIYANNGDFMHLKNAILNLVEDKSKLEEMSIQAYKLFNENYTAEKSILKFIHLINSDN